MQTLRIFWAFCRPHTIIGSVVSITTLFLLAIPQTDFRIHIDVLLLTLIAGLACNILIVGLNQIIDIELDKINKPYLPLASGEMSVNTATWILVICLLTSLTISFYTSMILGWLIVLILLIGIIYSVPPIQLKRHHLPAALAITGVRGILVNVGMFLHFTFASGSALSLSWPPLWILTGFVTIFSLTIAWFKDLPDVDGDRRYEYKTAAVLYSVKVIFRTGSLLLGLAYLGTIFWAVKENDLFLGIAHVAAISIFITMVARTQTESKESVARFYKYFWGLFFWEYLVFGAWVLV